MLAGLLVVSTLSGAAASEEVSLARDVMPLIARSCTECHQREGGNRKAVENGPYLEKKSDILGVTGTLIIPGKPENSYLLITMSPPQPGRPRHNMMPPKRSKARKMTDAEIKKIAAWIKDGAKDN
jgi:cytochrome c553